MNLSYLDSLMHIKALRTAYNLQKAVGNQQTVCVPNQRLFYGFYGNFSIISPHILVCTLLFS